MSSINTVGDQSNATYAVAVDCTLCNAEVEWKIGKGQYLEGR
jgi:hypothetical protein